MRREKDKVEEGLTEKKRTGGGAVSEQLKEQREKVWTHLERNTK